MSLDAQDHYHLTRTNRAIRKVAEQIPGAEARETGETLDFGTGDPIPVLALVAGPHTFTLDWLNAEEAGDYWVEVLWEGEYVGRKMCGNFPHFINATKKMAGMTPDELAGYLDGPLTRSRRWTA